MDRAVKPGRSLPMSAAELSSRMVYCDEQLLVFDKPSGLTVIPGRDEVLADSLRGRLQEFLGTPLWIVHRIDRATSGLVIFARTSNAHRMLCMQFEQHQISKTYWALAAGLLPESGETRLALHTARKGKMRPALKDEAGALAAHTSFRRLNVSSSVPPISELQVQPHSGRQHQIRVHLRALGAPLYGDELYASST